MQYRKIHGSLTPQLLIWIWDGEPLYNCDTHIKANCNYPPSCGNLKRVKLHTRPPLLTSTKPKSDSTQNLSTAVFSQEFFFFFFFKWKFSLIVCILFNLIWCMVILQTYALLLLLKLGFIYVCDAQNLCFCQNLISFENCHANLFAIYNPESLAT